MNAETCHTYIRHNKYLLYIEQKHCFVFDTKFTTPSLLIYTMTNLLKRENYNLMMKKDNTALYDS